MRLTRTQWLCGVALLVTTSLVVLFSPSPPPTPSFASVVEFRAWATARGLVVWPEDRDFAVTVSDLTDIRSRLDREDVDLDDAVIQVLILGDTTVPARGESRVWGRVMAWGSPRLLAKIDAMR